QSQRFLRSPTRVLSSFSAPAVPSFFRFLSKISAFVLYVLDSGSEVHQSMLPADLYLRLSPAFPNFLPVAVLHPYCYHQANRSFRPFPYFAPLKVPYMHFLI